MNVFVKSVGEKVLVAIVVAAILAIPFRQAVIYLVERLGPQGRIPSGTILAWNALGKIPDGWQVCDGRNGTPDLRDRFLLGTTPDLAGKAVGEATHFHKFAANTSTILNADSIYGIGSTNWKKEPEHGQLPDRSHIHSVSGDTSPTPNLPPSYTVVFIIRQ